MATPATELTSDLIKLALVQKKTAQSVSGIYRGIARGDFPKPVRIGPRAVAWVEAEVDEWIQQRIEASRQKGAA
ncbi:helix-turn-helix transcriptional regulator [Vreelandella titanicae]|jgi:prophage regulatory protein|uniref:helix-turn-helix transcriptional regulator n=1 Tax=Vreelandella titanicae TaxID=664683 RepID=UPI0039BFFE7A